MAVAASRADGRAWREADLRRHALGRKVVQEARRVDEKRVGDDEQLAHGHGRALQVLRNDVGGSGGHSGKQREKRDRSDTKFTAATAPTLPQFSL